MTEDTPTIELTLAELTRAVEDDAAIRRHRRLLPAGGSGDKIFPPTYPGENRNDPARHVFETRRIDGNDVRCVLIDSVQSQANRLEEALLDAIRDGRLSLPYVAVDFAGAEAHDQDLSDIGLVTSLDAPHRVYDAILRDAELPDGTPFVRSLQGQALHAANVRRASALFKLSPSALVFGAWHSTGEGGGLGAKFPRVIVSEIVGVGAVGGHRAATRVDPLGVISRVEVYKGDGIDWALDPALLPGKPKKVRPSEINHSNIITKITDGGVTIDYAQHAAVITLAGLRRLRFPTDDAVYSRERDTAARAVLAALALLALAEQDRCGYALRSRCDLVPDGPAAFELIGVDGTARSFRLDTGTALQCFADAADAAKSAGFAWTTEPLRLVPQQRLVELVALSRAKALAGEGEPAGEGDSK